MEFLNELYSNEYFGIGLFIVITILAFSFLVILFFGKKDEKARLENEQNKENEVKIEEIKPEDVNMPEAMDSITLNEEESVSEEEPEDTIEFTPLNSNELEETQNEELEVFEEKKIEDLDPFVTSNLVLNTDYINEKELEEETTYSEPINEIPIVEEDPSIDEVLSKYDAIEEQSLQEENTPVIHEEQDEGIFGEQDLDEKPTVPFSSVYLDKEEPTVKETDGKVDLDKTRNLFELPKRVDLPKRSDNTINDNIISSMNDHKE